MTVICIDANPRYSYKQNQWLFCLKEGGTYEIEKEIDDTYKIVGISSEIVDRPTFNKSRFIPLSNIDEKEFIREYKKELV